MEASRRWWAVLSTLALAGSGCGAGETGASDAIDARDEATEDVGGAETGVDADADAGAEMTADAPADAEGGASGFDDVNGFLWFYNTAQAIRFADVAADLDALRARGFRVLGFYAPYEADPDKWLGAIPLDPYATPAVSGTLAEWRALVAAAHARGMRVVAYFSLTVVDARSPLFTAAETQYAAGDRASREVSAFRWAASAAEPLPGPATGPSEWRWSARAGAYYWSVWGEAAIDPATPGGRAEVERIERFWLDTGLDGFMWDAGLADPALRHVMAEFPRSVAERDLWLTFESTNYEEADVYAEFGLTSWFNLEDDDEANDYSYVARDGDSPDDLEEALRRSDRARSRGLHTHAWSLWEDEGLRGYPDEDAMRVQEAAVLAAAGILYGIPESTAYDAWPAPRRARFERVLAAVNDNPALHPSASRARVPAQPADRAYAMLRTSRDGAQTALLAYNLGAARATVTLNLAGTAVATSQTPADLCGGGTPPPMDGPIYAIDLPPYGFTILQVSTR